MSFHHRAGLKHVGLYARYKQCVSIASSQKASQVFVNDSILVQSAGTGQEYCSRIFSRPICFVMALFLTAFRTVLEVTILGMYSQSTRGPELFFLQVV